jgi:hypothetical protein
MNRVGCACNTLQRVSTLLSRRFETTAARKLLGELTAE